MVKRTLSLVLALTVLASCLMGLPVMASATEAITDITAGGAFAENIAMTNDEFLSAPNFVESSTISYSKSGDTNIVGTITQKGDSGWVNFADAPELKNAGKPGTHVAVIQGTVALTNNDWSKLKTVEMQVLPYLDSNNTVAQTSSDWSSLRNNSEANGLYMGPGADYKILEPYTNEEVDVKYVYTFTDGETAGTKDVSVTPSFRLSGQTEWTEVTTATKTQTGIANATIGKIRLRFRLSGTPTEYAIWQLKNFSVVEPTPADVAIADLGGKTYEANALVPLNYVLPVGYKSAKISVGGVDVKTLTETAGAYKANLNLAAVSASGNVEITLSGVGADDVAFSKTTKIYVPSANSGSLNTALLTQPAPGGVYQDIVLADNLDILGANADNAVANGTTRTYTAATEATPVATMTFTNDTTNLGNATMSSQIEGTNDKRAVGSTLELAYDVTVIGGNPTSTPNQYFGFSLGTYFGSSNGDTHATTSGWLLMTTRTGGIYVNGSKILDHDKESATGTTVSIKNVYEILSETSVKCTMYYKKADGTWGVGATQTKTVTDTRLRTIKAWQWMNKTGDATAACTITYKLSNASLKELGKKTAAISDLSASSYLPTDSAKVDFVLPEGYLNAELTIGTTKAASFEGAITEAGAYTATINMAEIKQDGTIPVVLSGTLADGSAFKAETTVYIQKAGAGSLDEEIFANPVAGGYYDDRVAMNSDAFLAASKFADASNANLTYTRPTTEGGVATLNAKGNSGSYSGVTFAGAPLLNQSSADGKQVVELTMDVKADDLTCFTGKDGAYVLQFFPYINGTAKRFAYPYDALVFRCNGAGGDGNLTYTWGIGWANRTANVYTAGTVIEYKLVSEIENGTLTATQYARVKGTEEWQVGPTKSFTELTDAVLDGFGMAVNTQSTSALDLTKGITWTLSNAKVVEKEATYAKLEDVSNVLYTQYDNAKLPVSFCLPEGYKEAYLMIDGKDVAEFTNVSHPAGAYKSEIDLSKLDFAFTHSVVLEGKMGDGTPFTKAAKTVAIAATEGAEEADAIIETPTTDEIANVTGTADAFVLTGTAYVKKNMGGGWSNHDANSNPNGPFLTQYITELTADVDFTNAVPTLSLIAGRTAESQNYSDGLSVPINVELPKKAFKLMVRTFTIHPETGYGDTTYAYVYADGQYIGSTVYTQTNAWSMGDHFGYMTLAFGKPVGYADQTIGIKNLTWNKYSAGMAKAELGATPKTVIVAFDKDMSDESAQFITLVDKAGEPVAAEVVVSGATATITATSDIPAYASVVIGAGVKEADYEFGAYSDGIVTKTRLGEALSKGYTIKLNNKPTKTEVYGVTTEKDGNNIVAEVELYTLAAETVGKLVVAGYDENGVMQGIDILNVATEKEGEATLTLTAEFDGAFASYKVFLWKDVDGAMVPILSVK